MNHESAMRRAIQLSIEKMEAGEGGPFGAVIVKDGEILAEGWNQVTSTTDPTAHAEIVAIRRACQELGTFSLEGAVIHTSCEPCPMCLAAIYWARVTEVHYGNDKDAAASAGFDDAFLYDELTVPMPARRVRFTCTLADEARTGFERWAAKADKVAY